MPPPQITTQELQDATIGQAYFAELAVTGGEAPYTWDLVSGRPPGGLALNREGTLTGTPGEERSTNITVRVRDGTGQVATAALGLSAVPLFGDITRDGVVDCADLAAMQEAWDWGEGTRAGHPADLNGDGGVDATDYSLLASNPDAAC